MRTLIEIILCLNLLFISAYAFAGAVPTITVYAEPPELEIWADGERIGVGEAVLFGPFDDYVEITVRGEAYEEITQVVDPPTEEDEDVVVVVVSEKVRGFSWSSMALGVGTGLATASVVFLAFIIIFD